MKKDNSNTVQQENELRLIRWANDGYPPINFCNEGRAVIDLTKGYLNLRNEYDQLQEQVKGFREEWYKAQEEVKALKNEIEVMKHNKKALVSLALEFGYKQCEKGENIQAAFENYNSLIR